MSTSAGKTRKNQARRIGAGAEVAHVGVQRLGAGDREHDAAERDERLVPVVEQELGAVVRRQRAEDRGMLEQPAEPGDRQHAEPHAHDRPEVAADAPGAEALHGEQPGQHDERERDDEVLRGPSSTTSSPSTADSTEIAGVIMPSP